MTTHAPWILASPWYRTDSVTGATDSVTGARRGPGCGSPIIQKYASSDPITPFRAEPQRSLRFTGDDLLHHLFGRRHQLLDTSNRGSEPLKLFQPLHARFYLVVCELFCQVPGWPAVPRDRVCEAGFVVRRKTPVIPKDKRIDLNLQFARKQELRTRAEYIATKALREETDSSEGIQRRVRQFLINAGNRAGNKKLEELEREFDKVDAEITKLVGAGDIHNQVEGWLAGDHPGVGAWAAKIEAEPRDLGAELVYPLFPLTPDPSIDGHSATGSSMYYGLIPTHSGDIDDRGAPRFDDRSLYHISCFVRRHREGCPRTATPGDCHGELVWSLPTESFRLASPYDLDGTSNRPVNIRMPDLGALEAHARRSGPGGSVGVRFNVPPSSALPIKTDVSSDVVNVPDPVFSDPDPDVDGRGDQVCFYAIPLITLVALFVLNIFLPILLFLFHLWFMLRLKLCIPPTINIEGDLALALENSPPELETELETNANFKLKIGGTIFSGGNGQASVAAVKAALQGQLKQGGELDTQFLDKKTEDALKNEIENDLDNAVDLIRTMGANLASDAVAGKDGTLANGTRGLVYFNVVART